MIPGPRKNPDPLQKQIDLSLARGYSSLKMLSNSVHNFLRYFAQIHADHYENITSLAEAGLVITENELHKLGTNIHS